MIFTDICQPSATSKPQKKSLDYSLRTQNLVKPQLGFDVKPDNEDTSPWLPLLKTKPHAKVSLEDSLGMITSEYNQQQYVSADLISLALPLSELQREKITEYLSRSAEASRFKEEYKTNRRDSSEKILV